jgi:hypothetical protein
MLGLHGNGLTYLLWMQPNRLSTVIEIFVLLDSLMNITGLPELSG